jgi:hypothetical protein
MQGRSSNSVAPTKTRATEGDWESEQREELRHAVQDSKSWAMIFSVPLSQEEIPS